MTSIANRSRLLAPILFLAAISTTGGCVMNEAAMQAPKQSASFAVAQGTETARIFGCAERELQALAAQDRSWVADVTRRDLGSAVLETGNYADENVSGFRVQLRHRPETNMVELELKGAGAYFVDLGVDAATQTFRQRLEHCLAGGA